MHEQIRILKSPSDGREYKALRLPNGLSVILIHDPEIRLDGEELEGDDGWHCHSRPLHGVLHDQNEGASSLSEEQSREDGIEMDRGTDSGDSGSDDSDIDEQNVGHIRSKQRHTAHIQGGLKKAAAALSVGVGHFSDPQSLQGLSHYLEHMLFMGSEKYPDENEYDAFLSAHSGSSNAYTEEEATTFHFDCAPSSLEQALDRFAQFFVCPLFKKDAMDREVKAVNNEFTGVLQSDQCRLLQLRAHTAKDGHPSRGFGWGNYESLVTKPSLSGINVRDALLQHYKEQYSAERMNLVVIGGQPLLVLENWVTDKFSLVSGGKGARTTYKEFGKPFVVEESCGKLYILPSVRDEHRLSIVFQFPDLQEHYLKKAEDYLSHLLGHEGYGSLLAGLKNRGWATGLSAGTVDQTSAAWLFDITITLTEAGLLADAGYGMSAVGLVFEYITMLKSMNPQKWAWDELKKIADMKWQFLEEEEAADYVAQIASDMHIYPVEHALAGSYLHLDFDQGLINELLAQMTPQLVRLELQTRDFEGCLSRARADKRLHGISIGEEPWFSFPFASCSLPSDLVEAWGTTGAWSTDLRLPPRNPYLPTNFDIICDRTPKKEGDADLWPSPPELLLKVPGMDLWHKLDSHFRKPRAFAYFRLSLPNTNTSPRVAAMTHLVVKLLEDALCQEAYLADVADLHYGIAFEGAQGIDVKIEGFNDKLPLLTKLVFQTLATLDFQDEDYVRIHEELVRSYRNALMKPGKHAAYSRLLVLKLHLWGMDPLLHELEGMTATEIRDFVNRDSESYILKDAHVRCLFMGNLSSGEALDLGKTVSELLDASGLPGVGDRTLRIPDNWSLLLTEKAINIEEENSAVEIYIQCGLATDPRTRALVDMVDQLMYEPCYDTLRTKEQLGYTVSSGSRLTHGVMGFGIFVQSGTHGPLYLDERVESFLVGFEQRLMEMPAEEFEQNRQSLLKAKKMKDKSMIEEVERAWDGLVNRGSDFMARKDEVAALEEVTQNEVIQFYSKFFTPAASGSIRKRLAVYVAGKEHREDGSISAEAAPTWVTRVIGDVEMFKRDCSKNLESSFYPAVTIPSL